MEKITLDLFTKYKFLSNLSFAPDGAHAAFTVSQANMETNGYDHNIWLYHGDSQRVSRLTGMDSERSFIWEDEDTILFPAVRKNKHKKEIESGKYLTVYQRMSISGGEATEAFTVPLRVSGIHFLEKGKYLLEALYEIGRPDVENMSGEEQSKALKQLKEEKDYYVFDELPFWVNGKGVTNKQRSRLYLFDAASGQLTPISSPTCNVGAVSLSDDKTKVVYAGPDYDSVNPQFSALMLYDIPSGKTETLVEGGTYTIMRAAFYGDCVLFAGSDRKHYGTSENAKFYTVSPATKEVKLFADPDRAANNSVGSDCRLGAGRGFKIVDGIIYSLFTLDNTSYLCRMDKDGSVHPLTADNGSIDCFDMANGKTLFIGMRDMRLQELYDFDLSTGEEKRLTGFNEEITEKYYVSLPEPLSFTDKDGVRIDGWVMKPYAYDPNKNYPAVFDIHGGPKAAYGAVFNHEMQYWASEGYFVFFCNPRGSDGRGNEFADLRGKYGTVDYSDLMEFADNVLEKYPQIDQKKVCETGGSYGGFMTNWIIGHTDRFAAAVSQRSISNWISKCLTTDIGYYHNMDAMQSTPWTDFDKMWGFSPLKYADKCTTPTLFIHSGEDYRCWQSEGIQMFTALKYHGCEARLCYFKGENHELSRSGKPKHRIRRLKEITEWFDAHVK
ncbi:MAG: S9 family peptidase [Oscillospiraceae bacterium]|jgi:dipeptidyl aminopeptidase/acylaminoacyl peptidase|nr:S9 family peptidase [Oscillospiraceae bacterium]